MKAAPSTERVARFRWVATLPTFGSPHVCADGTVRVPIAAQCAVARTRRGALRGLRNHPITAVFPGEETA